MTSKHEESREKKSEWKREKKGREKTRVPNKWRLFHQRNNKNGIETMRQLYCNTKAATLTEQKWEQYNDYKSMNSKRRREKRIYISLNENKYLYVLVICIWSPWCCRLECFQAFFHVFRFHSFYLSYSRFHCLSHLQQFFFHKLCYYFNIWIEYICRHATRKMRMTMEIYFVFISILERIIASSNT